MPNPYPVALRERAVRAYEDTTDTYVEVAERFHLGVNTVLRWVQRARDTGDLAPRAKGGGWRSPVDWAVLERLVTGQPDRTLEELTRAYNRAAAAAARVHRSSIIRALRSRGYVFKKNAVGRRSRIERASRPSGRRSGPGSPT
jgi:transposase